MNKMKEIKIYTTKICPACEKAKNFFKARNILYEEIDVSGDDNARREMIELSGQMSVPVIVIGNEIIDGFRPVTMERLIT